MRGSVCALSVQVLTHCEVPNKNSATIKQFFEQHIQSGTTIFTDSAGSYKWLDASEKYKHEGVVHARGEFARTNEAGPQGGDQQDKLVSKGIESRGVDLAKGPLPRSGKEGRRPSQGPLTCTSPTNSKRV